MLRRKRQDKGENRKKMLSKNFCLLSWTLSREHKLNFDAMLSNSYQQQRKLLKKHASVEKEEAGSHSRRGWREQRTTK